ncbi:aminopeptidase N [Micromonospora sp. NPDC049240]|uniref:aminopeptidase N n=1 Tax=Micromonospora sp. NPDC049240 TaxID=3155151 RepID=UPI0033CFF2E1
MTKLRSLTHEEAVQRAAILAVERYDIAIDLTGLPSGPMVRCVSTVTFTCREPDAQSFADCAAPVISATLNGVALPAAVDGRIPLPRLAAYNTLRVETEQADTTGGAGVHRAVDPADGEVYVWTTFEPDNARHVWACFDQPDLKAPHTFTVTAPEAWTVVSNSPAERADPDGGARRWTFAPTPPLSPYNTVVNAGPLHEIRRTVGGYDLGLYARRSLADILERDADEIFTLTRQGLAFFAEAFAMPFPQQKYDHVFMPEFGGAMENYGCVTWADYALRRVPPTPAERHYLATVLLHEMAHMWFGNIVTMRWWDDVWLNEAFAEFACHWAATDATEHTDAWACQLAADKIYGYLVDQSPGSHPIRQAVRDVAEAAAIFDDITYVKGSAVLRQLMIFVGEDRFRAGMQTYFARHAWDNTTLQDLIDAIGEASGRDLNAWREVWLDTAGTDRFTLVHDGAGPVLVGHRPQGPPRPQVLGVGAYRWESGELSRTALARVEVAGSRTPVPLPAGADLYLVNDDDLTFAAVRPATGDRTALIAAAGSLPTSVSRAVAVATIWNMLTDGDVTAAAAVHTLTSVLAVETSGAAIESYLTRAGDAALLWAPDEQRAALTSEVRTVAAALAAQPTQARAARRVLARIAMSLDDVAGLRADFQDDIDLSWRLLIRAAALGAATQDAVEELLRRDTDPDAGNRALAVRAATPDPGEKAAVWQAVAVDRTVSFAAIHEIAAAFWQPGQGEVLAPFGERYLQLMLSLDEVGMVAAIYYSQALFPVFGIGTDFLDEAEKVAQAATPVARRRMTERRDEVWRMLRSRSAG